MERPTSVTVLAIINMLFAVWGFCGLTMSGAVFFLPSDPMMPNPVVELLHTSAIYKAWYILAIGLGFFAVLALGASGVGLLRVAGWGRMLAIGSCIYAFVSGILGQLVNAVYIYMPLFEQMDDGNPAVVGAGIGGLVGGACGGCVGFLYPCILLYFMTRPHIVALFNEQEGATGPSA